MADDKKYYIFGFGQKTKNERLSCILMKGRREGELTDMLYRTIKYGKLPSIAYC